MPRTLIFPVFLRPNLIFPLSLKACHFFITLLFWPPLAHLRTVFSRSMLWFEVCSSMLYFLIWKLVFRQISMTKLHWFTLIFPLIFNPCHFIFLFISLFSSYFNPLHCASHLPNIGAGNEEQNHYGMSHRPSQVAWFGVFCAPTELLEGLVTTYANIPDPGTYYIYNVSISPFSSYY